MAQFRNYDPKQILISFSAVLVQGFGDGDFMSAERDEDAFSKVTGADGNTTRIRNRNEGGKVTLTLLAESQANDALMLAYLADQGLGLGRGPLLVRNLNGTTLIDAPEAWIMKLPPVTFGKDGAGVREWVIDCAQLNKFVGGALL